MENEWKFGEGKTKAGQTGTCERDAGGMIPPCESQLADHALPRGVSNPRTWVV